ncbi:MAG: hypothetical protein WC764_04545 [Candidatus Paceibacterota bacterium]|jgi:uncharacterized HAD superfamily protein
MNIGLDFDGVIANTGFIKSLAAKRLFQKELPISCVKTSVAIANNILTDEQYKILRREIYDNYSWLVETPAISKSIESMNALIKSGHKLEIITARFPEGREHIESWLAKHSINVPLTCVGYGVSKAQSAKDLDIFVEDDAKNLVGLIKYVPKLFLFDQPYNLDEEVPMEIGRAKDWDDLLSKIESL